MTDNDKKLHQLTEGVTRIANYMEESKSEQETRITDGQDLSWPLALARGPRTKLQAASHKLQASSGKLDKTTL